jgi:hypothetical protein
VSSKPSIVYWSGGRTLSFILADMAWVRTSAALQMQVVDIMTLHNGRLSLLSY